MSSVIRGEIVHFVPQSFHFSSIGAIGIENEVLGWAEQTDRTTDLESIGASAAIC